MKKYRYEYTIVPNHTRSYLFRITGWIENGELDIWTDELPIIAWRITTNYDAQSGDINSTFADPLTTEELNPHQEEDWIVLQNGRHQQPENTCVNTREEAIEHSRKSIERMLRRGE